MSYFNPYLTTKPKPDTSYFYGDQAAMNQRMQQQVKMSPDYSVPPILPDSGEGPNWGNISAITTAGVSAVGDAFGIANQGLNIETSAPPIQTSATGEPVYNTGQFYNQASMAKPQGATAGEVAGGALKTGASVLAATGNPLLAGGAALGSAALNLFGGRRRKKRQEEQKQKAIKSAKSAQKSYNTASLAFDEQQASQADYLKRMNNTNRLWNLYS